MRRERRRTWRQRTVIALLAASTLASVTVALALAEVARVTASIDRLPVAPALDPPTTGAAGEDGGPVPVLSFLVVGVDGEGGRRDDGDGPRPVLADSMMIVRTTAAGAEVLPLPRDLWGEIPGHGEAKLNAAMAYGAADGPGGGQALLIETIRHRYGLVVNHYVEVDFAGFVALVDDVGGIDLYVPTPARDATAQLALAGPGCTHLDGTAALRLARSRRYQSEADGEWGEDPTADLGRIRRQQVVLRAALAAAIDRGVRNPVALRRLATGALDSLAVDDSLSLPDLLDLGTALRSVGVDDVVTHTLGVENGWRGGQAVVELVDSPANQAVLDRFRAAPSPPSTTPATTAAPPPPPTTTPPPPPPPVADPLARFTPSLLQPDRRPC